MERFFYFFAKPEEVSGGEELVCQSEKALPDGRHLFIKPPFVLVESEKGEKRVYLFSPFWGLRRTKFLLFPSEVSEGQNVMVLFGTGRTLPHGLEDIAETLDKIAWDFLADIRMTLYADRSNLVVPCKVVKCKPPEDTEDLYKSFGIG